MPAPHFMPVDANDNQIGGGASPTVVQIQDGVIANKATVSAFHNADNQALAATAFGILTGGVAQLANASGNLDRQRETAGDVISNIGIATGAQQLAWPVVCGPVTSGAITGSANAQTITLTNVTGTVRGVAWALVVGQTLVLEPNTGTQEAFVITAINAGAKTVTGIIKNNHSITAPATAFFYDQARSGIIADGSTGQGIVAGATYLFNSGSNSGNGGWEGERSAAGELDGATGTGTAIAAEYEHNSGGPVLASGLASGFQFDRARNLQGKGRQTGAITSTTAGNTSIVFSGGASATNLLQPGSPVTLTGSGTAEVVYATSSWVPGSSATVTLQSPVVNSAQTSAAFDTFAAQGPQLSGFSPYGIGIEEECLYDPVSGLYYIERSATQDAVSANNVVLETPGLWNGASVDRQRGNVDTGALITATGATTTQTTADQTNYNGRGVKVVLDMTTVGTGSVTATIQGKDTASGKYYTLLAGAAVATNSTNVYSVYPGLPATTNVSANDLLPRTWRVVVTANNANPTTYSVGASVIV
jgi:hypothetical protein